ncbi:hypothetical protein C2G38_1791222 [Gigaspora rosea]|uniref:Uncharacterized protein n=1 Tax=Gigaspora rosea TaxID=44941 RepID=A0A397USD9_9GLOM|nr:hypothetical protein C2G38_1791222 [Gigaspora rosea]
MEQEIFSHMSQLFNSTMEQGIFDHLNNGQKTTTKHIFFQNSNGQPNLSGDTLNVYDYITNTKQMKGQLDLAPFPNLGKITFDCNIRFNILESINISKNDKLSRILISGNNQNFFEKNIFTLLIKETQLNRVILSYNKYKPNGWIKTTKHLREQAIIPYFLVEDNKLESEVASLKDSLAQREQTIAKQDRIIVDLNKKAKQAPTLNQFQELNNIALGRIDLDFEKLKQEIKRLKLKDFNPYFREQKSNFEKLKSAAKNQATDSLVGILDLFLQTNRQIIESENGDSNSFVKGQLQGQLTTCQTLLQTKFTQEELQILLSKQKELMKLEDQSVILQ